MTKVPAWVWAVVAIVSVQISSVLSLPLIEQIGSAGTAWLRLSAGALILLVAVRPRLWELSRRDLPLLALLGCATGLMTTAFLAAISSIPLGTAVAIEFLGPLTVASVSAARRHPLMLAIPVVALAGVVLMTEPWAGTISGRGVLWALMAAVGWGSYIVFTQKVGDRFSGLTGLSMTLPIAALVAAPFGIPQVVGHLSWQVILVGIGVALLSPVAAYGLEMLALRTMNHHAFGTLMAVEPTVGLAAGWLCVAQQPGVFQLVGMSLVLVASVLAQSDSSRE